MLCMFLDVYDSEAARKKQGRWILLMYWGSGWFVVYTKCSIAFIILCKTNVLHIFLSLFPVIQALFFYFMFLTLCA